MKSHKSFRLAYRDLALTHSKGQSQGHAHFDCNDLYNIFTARTNNRIVMKYYTMTSYEGFGLVYLELTLAYCKGHLDLWNDI